jgi:hypothetical protein
MSFNRHHLRLDILRRWSRCGRRRRVDVGIGDVEFPGRVDPLAVIGDAAIGLDGVDDVVGRGPAGIGVFDDGAKRVTELVRAAGEEAGRVGVAIDGVDGQLEVVGDVAREMPVEEGFVDGFALGMIANKALTRMAIFYSQR